jgi:hypothetical protein
MDELLTRIDNSRKAMQTVLIPASKENCAIMLDAQNVLEECFRFVFGVKMEQDAKQQKEGAENA